MNLTGKLEIIYGTLLDYQYKMSLLPFSSPHLADCCIQTEHGERGEMGSSKSVAAAACCGFLWRVVYSPLIASRNTAVVPVITCYTLAYKFPPNDNAKSLLMPANVECNHSNRLTTASQLSPTCDRLTDGDHPSTLVSHCQHSGLLRKLGLLFYTRWRL